MSKNIVIMSEIPEWAKNPPVDPRHFSEGWYVWDTMLIQVYFFGATRDECIAKWRQARIRQFGKTIEEQMRLVLE